MSDLPKGVALEDAPCPLGCTQGDRHVVDGHDRLHGIPGNFTIVACEQCGLMRTNPRPTASTIGAYYPADYGPYLSTAMPVGVPSAKAAGWRSALYGLLGLESRRIPSLRPGRILELGCASGSFLVEMRSRGWAVQGIEFSESSAAKARALDLDVQTASVETARPPTEPVDVVAAWMVLEHLHQPIYALKQIRKWVRPDGWLVASVPDASALAHRVFGTRSYDLHLPNHLYHYTPRTIASVLNGSGWRLERIWWQRNPNTLLGSLGYLARDRGWLRTQAAVSWLQTSRRAGKMRVLLGWILGVTHQSGRMEIWARPTSNAEESLK